MNESQNTSDLKQKAFELAHKYLLIDTHIDVPYRLQIDNEDISKRTKRGHFDYERAKEGGLDAVFMAVYIPADFEQKGGGKKFADELISNVNEIINKNPDKFSAASSPEEIRMNFEINKISVLMGMENGTGLEDDLNNVEYFYNKGIRYVTLTHSKCNRICDSSYDEERKWNGLSPFGEKVIAEMNRLGMIIDISHVSDSAFYDILKLSQAPVVATHSSCRHFTPDWERNMSDEMIKSLVENNGIIMINFGSIFIDSDFRKRSDQTHKELVQFLKDKNIKFGDISARNLVDEYFKINNLKNVTVEQVADHFDHVKELVGIDNVGIGSDYDGVRFMPRRLDDVSMYPNLIFEFLKRGYSDEDIEKICSKNFLRVWGEIESIGKELRKEI